MPRDSWLVEIQNHHPGYLSWEGYLENQDRIEKNRPYRPEDALPSNVREGLALLQGLLVCGNCGRRLTVRYRGNGGIYPVYECTWLRRQGRAKRSCMRIQCPVLDQAVQQRVLESVDSNTLTLALAAHDELFHRDEALTQQWKMRLQRVQYEADLAQRRYEEVDPSNRLVAASLEKRWNDALSRVEEVRRQMADFQRQQTRTFTPQQRAQILALAGDFPRLWNSDTTSAKDKKRMLRLLVDNITVERGEDRSVSLHVCWAGGAREDLEVLLPRKVQDQVRHLSRHVEEVRRLARDHTDAQIVDLLNGRGERTAKGNPFTVASVKWIRHKHRIPAPQLKLSHELNVDEVAAKFHVSRGVVYYWINRDVLPARRIGDGHPYWITLTESKVEELQKWVQSSKRIASVAS
jgi:hypothetical protein